MLRLFPLAAWRRDLAALPNAVSANAPFHTTLRSRALLLVALSALPPLAVMLSMATQWRRHEVVDAQTRALELVRRASAVHERQLQACERTLASLEAYLELLPTHRDTVASVVSAVLSSPNPDENIGFYTAGGQLLASVRPSMRLDVASRPFFARAVSTGRVAIDDYTFDLDRRSAMVSVAHPVLDGAGRTDRVILHVFDVGWLRGVGADLSMPPGTILAVFDNDGSIVAQHSSAGVRLQAARHSPLVQAAIGSTHEGTLESDAFDGVRRTFAYAPLRDSDTGRDLFIAVGIPLAVATALADRTLFLDFIGFGIAIVVGLIAASMAGERLVLRHVRALGAAADRFGTGDMSARAGTAGRPAELAHLAAAFDSMADALEARQREVVGQRDRAALQEARIRAILENSNEGVSLGDASGRWLYVSPPMARLLGCSPEDLLGRHARDFVLAADREALDGLLAEAVSRPGRVLSGCIRLRHRDGEWRWIACDVQNLLDDPAVGAVLATCRDITDYRHTQDALRAARDELDLRVRERTAALVKANQALEAEIAERKRTQATLQMLSYVVDQTADSVFVTSRDGIIEYVNPAFERLTGYSQAEAAGQTPRLFSSGLHDARFFRTLWAKILAGQVFRTIVTNRTRDGRLFDEDQTITPMRDASGAITHFISTGRDITERKRTEQAVRRLNQQLEQETTRIANLLHDEAGQFLTSAHILLADLGRDLPAAGREQVQVVRRHLDQVEESLRTLSHDLHPRTLTDLGLVAALRFRAELFSRRTGVTAVVEAVEADRLPHGIEVAVYRLAQEALTNAGKYARASRVTIALARSGPRVTCSVQDDGCGFDPAQVAARDTPTLGIENMRDRIEALGGTLEIVSRAGEGTLVRAVLPVEG